VRWTTAALRALDAVVAGVDVTFRVAVMRAILPRGRNDPSSDGD
jgi:hypothetical protein